MSKIKLGNRPRYKQLNRRNNRNGKITNFHQQIRPLLTDKADTPAGLTMFFAQCFLPRKESSKKYIRTQKDRLHLCKRSCVLVTQMRSYQCLSFRKQPATATPNPRKPRTYPKKLFVVTAIPKSIVAIPNNSILIPFTANTSVTNSDLSIFNITIIHHKYENFYPPSVAPYFSVEKSIFL